MSIITINIDTDNYSVDAIAKSVKEQMDALVKPKFPKWEELGVVEGWYVDDSSELDNITSTSSILLLDPCDKNVWPTKELAEACLALSQLAQLRDYVNGDWKADWSDGVWKCVIEVHNNKIYADYYDRSQYFLAFKDAETRDGFLEAYRDLIEIAKPLL
tara:strand:+ start:168 stop:644 length:477 start_codon:yes stop_codon:yes gene_type:complete